MNELIWFSSKIRFVCIIEGCGGTRYRDSIYLFRAKEYDDAFQLAINIANSKGESYKNVEGQKVEWKAKEIISLDRLGAVLESGVELYSESMPLEKGVIIIDSDNFLLADSNPTQTI